MSCYDSFVNLVARMEQNLQARKTNIVVLIVATYQRDTIVYPTNKIVRHPMKTNVKSFMLCVSIHSITQHPSVPFTTYYDLFRLNNLPMMTTTPHLYLQVLMRYQLPSWLIETNVALSVRLDCVLTTKRLDENSSHLQNQPRSERIFWAPANRQMSPRWWRIHIQLVEMC